MPVTTLYTRQQAIRLSPGSDVDALKGRIVAASGGAPEFVDVETASGSHVSVLVTGRTEIWFETVDRVDEPSAASVAELPDFDYYAAESA